MIRPKAIQSNVNIDALHIFPLLQANASTNDLFNRKKENTNETGNKETLPFYDDDDNAYFVSTINLSISIVLFSLSNSNIA